MELITRETLEDDFIKKADRLSSIHRRELAELLGHPPDPRKVPPAFWKKVEKEERDLLLLFMLTIVTDNAVQHGLTGVRAESTARRYSQLRADWAVQKYVSNTQSQLLAGLRKLEADRGSLNKAPKYAVQEILKGIFGHSRNEAMISTEVTKASVHGSEAAMRHQGLLSPQDWWLVRPWRTKSGPCKRCEALSRKIRSEWRIIDAAAADGPPIHAFCACAIMYVSVGVEASIEFEEDLRDGLIMVPTLSFSN